MKNCKQKSKIMIGSLVVLFVLPGFAFAAAFNNSSNELSTCAVANVSRNPNSTSVWSNSVNADAGEVVGIRVYYHNTASESANNTRVFFNVPPGAASSFNVSCGVVADNAPQVTGSASINLSSTQTLTFIPGSFYWYPDQDTPLSNPITTPPGTQTESKLFSGGMELGNIPAAPSSRPYQFQGTVHTHFRVGGTSGGGTNTNLPQVTTQNASGIGVDSATLNGFVSLNGNSSASVFFEYSTNSSLVNPIRTSSQTFTSSTATFGNFINGLSSGTTYFYRAVAQSPNGQQSFGNILSFVAGQSGGAIGLPLVTTEQPTKVGNATTVILNGFLSSAGGGNANAIVNFEWGTTQSLGNQTTTQVISTGAFSSPLQNLAPSTVYYYRATARNSLGTSFGNILSLITNQGTEAPFVSTKVATGVANTSATINGFVSLPGNTQPIDAWFEWGPNGNLGNQTLVRNIGSPQTADFSATISELVPGSNYFYRAVARNSRGEIARGVILSFTTRGGTVASEEVTVRTTRQTENGGIRSLFILSYGVSNDLAEPGETVQYKIGWKNESTFTITDSVLRITLPNGTQFKEGDATIFRQGNVLLVNIGSIAPGSSGAVNFKAELATNLPADLVLPLKAVMSYNDPILKRQGDIQIEGALKVEKKTTGGEERGAISRRNISREGVAAVVGAFFPSTAIGWLLLIILVIIVSVIIRALV